MAAGAGRWLNELPGLIAGLERDWGITVGPPYPDATEAFVAEAKPASVLKPGGGFKLVDPDGLLAEAEYDLGVVMREDPVELRHGDPAERWRWLARRCGLDATAIWEWGAVERVSTGLLCTLIDLQPVGREMLATADYVATLPPAPV